MGCRCAERAKLLSQAGRAIARGQIGRATDRLKLTMQSGAGDAANLRKQMEARLKARARR